MSGWSRLEAMANPRARLEKLRDDAARMGPLPEGAISWRSVVEADSATVMGWLDKAIDRGAENEANALRLIHAAAQLRESVRGER